MNIQILELIEGAKAAKGLTVIIDVFRVMTVEADKFDFVLHVEEGSDGLMHTICK